MINYCIKQKRKPTKNCMYFYKKLCTFSCNYNIKFLCHFFIIFIINILGIMIKEIDENGHNSKKNMIKTK